MLHHTTTESPFLKWDPLGHWMPISCCGTILNHSMYKSSLSLLLSINYFKISILCERRSENNMGTRIDLCSMGNGELLVIIETSPSRDPLHYHSSSPPSSSPSSSSSGSASPPSSHHSSHHSHSHSHSVNIPASPSKSQPSLEERFAIATNLNRHSVPGFQRITCRY